MIIIGNQRDYTDQIIKEIIILLVGHAYGRKRHTIEWVLFLLLNHPESFD
ncbi:unnamed protein product [Coffea canephora]|uniref:Uncharacterized protein n=1 Tax=Coffea canephora TaxID=49390 RepID=A0A068UY62_COFCA|nr:unnamed protein product [Coffea canephora]